MFWWILADTYTNKHTLTNHKTQPTEWQPVTKISKDLFHVDNNLFKSYPGLHYDKHWAGITFAETMLFCKNNARCIDNDIKWEKETMEQFDSLNEVILQILRSNPTVKINKFEEKKGHLKALILSSGRLGQW